MFLGRLRADSPAGLPFGDERFRDEITSQSSGDKGLALFKADFRLIRKTKAGAQVNSARNKEMNQPVNDRKTRKSRGSPGAAFRALLALPEGALFTIYVKSPN